MVKARSHFEKVLHKDADGAFGNGGVAIVDPPFAVGVAGRRCGSDALEVGRVDVAALEALGGVSLDDVFNFRRSSLGGVVVGEVTPQCQESFRKNFGDGVDVMALCVIVEGKRR